MSSAVNRETFIALRATQQASRIARDVLNPPLEPYQIHCRQCGRPLDVLSMDVGNQIRCVACGRRTAVPEALGQELHRLQLRRITAEDRAVRAAIDATKGSNASHRSAFWTVLAVIIGMWLAAATTILIFILTS